MCQVTEGSFNSTVVDDVYFMVEKCLSRALALGEQTVLLEIIESSKNLFKSSLIPQIQARCRQLYPDAKTGDSIYIAVNDAYSASSVNESLVDEVRGMLDGQTRLYSIGKIRATEIFSKEHCMDTLGFTKLITAINELDLISNSYSSIIKSGVETIYNTQIKSKIVPVIVQAVRDTQVALQDNNYEDLQIRMIISFVDSKVKPILTPLCDENQIQVWLLVCQEIVPSLERLVLGSKWNSEGVSVLEREVRRLNIYFADLTDLQSKEIFIRLTQMISLLDNDSSEAALEYWHSLSNDKVLSENECKTLIQSNSDWI